MKTVKRQYRRIQLAGLSMLLCTGAGATEMVYAPVNPSFGGNPNNAPGLLGIAQAQNGFKAPTISPLQTFNTNLQNAILSRLSTEAVNTLFGKTSPLTPGTYDTAGYSIKITDAGNGDLTVQTTDKSTGALASFTVNAGTLAQ